MLDSFYHMKIQDQIHRESYMIAHVLLNLLNELQKSDKMRGLPNCAEKLFEPTIFFNLYTKTPYNSGSESLWRQRDSSPTWNLDVKS